MMLSRVFDVLFYLLSLIVWPLQLLGGFIYGPSTGSSSASQTRCCLLLWNVLLSLLIICACNVCVCVLSVVCALVCVHEILRGLIHADCVIEEDHNQTLGQTTQRATHGRGEGT